jgi:hypothetical protein
MDAETKRKWEILGEEYPEVAERLLQELGLAQVVLSRSSETSKDQKMVQRFFMEEFDKGTGDEFFETFNEAKAEELDENSDLLDRENFFDVLDKAASEGKLPRIPTEDGGFYYTTTLHCLIYLEERGDSDEIEVSDLYWFEEESGFPVQTLVWKVIDNPRMELTIPEAEITPQSRA